MYWYRCNNQYNTTSQKLCDAIKEATGNIVSPETFDQGFDRDGGLGLLNGVPNIILPIVRDAEYQAIPCRVAGRDAKWCAIGEYSATLFRSPDNFHHVPFVAVCTVDEKVMMHCDKKALLREWGCDADDILCLEHDFDLWKAEIAAGRFLTTDERHEIDGKYNHQF